jgi:hypothetical protein
MEEGMVGGVASASDSGKGVAEWKERSRKEVRKGEDSGISGRGLNEGNLAREFRRLATELGLGSFTLS